MLRPKETTTALLAGLVFGAILAFGLSSVAENSELDAGPRLMPYQGQLDLNGLPYDGAIDLQVTVGDTDGNTWSEVHDNVAVEGGLFGVNVGQMSSGLPNWVFDANDVYIELAVRNASSQDAYVELRGRQPIEVVPYTYWAAEGAYDTQVGRDVFIQGNTTIEGAARVDRMEINASGDANQLNVEGLMRFSSPEGPPHISGGLEFGAVGVLGATNSGHMQIRSNSNSEPIAISDGNAALAIFKDKLILPDVSFTGTGNADLGLYIEEGGSFTVSGHAANDKLIEKTEHTLNGANTLELGSSARRFCGLLMATDHNRPDHPTGCEVYEAGGIYTLRAYPDSECHATCITW